MCVCDVSEQRGPHISSVSATQGPRLLRWGSDAHAQLPCHRRPQSSRPPGHLAVLQPSPLRSKQHNDLSILAELYCVTVSVRSVIDWGGLFCLFFFFSLTVLPNEVDMSSPLIYGTPSSRVEGTPRSGVRGTPARQRPDLGSVRKAPQVDLHSEPVSGGFNSILSIIQAYVVDGFFGGN